MYRPRAFPTINLYSQRARDGEIGILSGDRTRATGIDVTDARDLFSIELFIHDDQSARRPQQDHRNLQGQEHLARQGQGQARQVSGRSRQANTRQAGAGLQAFRQEVRLQETRPHRAESPEQGHLKGRGEKTSCQARSGEIKESHRQGHLQEGPEQEGLRARHGQITQASACQGSPQAALGRSGRFDPRTHAGRAARLNSTIAAQRRYVPALRGSFLFTARALARTDPSAGEPAPPGP